MKASPAFTTVSARRKLTPVTSNPSANPPAPHAPRKVDWPQPVREYVQRSFAPEYEVAGVGREEIEKMLKRVITEAAENDRLNTVDWVNMPLPQAFVLQERSRSAPVPILQSTQAHNGFKNGDHVGSSNGTISRKRKSSDVPMTDAAADETQPPWRKTNNQNVFEDRITYASQDQADRLDKRARKKQDDTNGKGTSKYHVNLEKRKQRFENERFAAQQSHPWSSSRDDSPAAEANDGPIVGTCQTLEKSYLRLTAPPKPEAVRPLPVLEKTLELLKKKWRKESNYPYICDQFKSLRQDLTVQHIKNEFTVDVYEIHARIALEKGDLGEYNQCQTQLRALYSQNLGGHPAEFLAYRILYFIYTCNRTELNEVLADLTPTDKEQPAVKHALDVRSALALGNYHRFFRLYLDTPNMGAYLMDMFIVRERLSALANICKAYKPGVKIRFLTEELGFESDQDCAQFLCDHGAQELLEEKEDGVNFMSGNKLAFQLFDAARADAFRKVKPNGKI